MAAGNFGNASPPKSFAQKANNALYTVQLIKSGDPSGDNWTITANMPEKINFGISAQWDTPFARTNPDGSSAKAAAANLGMKMTGMTTKFRWQSAQVWESSSPFNISIPFVLTAQTDAGTDVKENFKRMLKLVTPSTMGGEDGLLIAPGRTVVGGALNGTKIKCIVGMFLTLEDAVVKSVSADMDSMFDSGGNPMSMTVSVELESFWASFTTSDVNAMF